MNKKGTTTSFKDYKKGLFNDPKFIKEYEDLEPEFSVIEQIIKARVERGLTQSKLAQTMKTKQSVISRVERGLANPSLSFLKRLALALDLKLKINFS